jgi:hypothetical protein
MERSELHEGQHVAVCSIEPAANRDLFSDWNAQFVGRAVVLDKPPVGGVNVGWITEDGTTPLGSMENVPSRRVLCTWENYLVRRQERADDVLGSKRNRQERLAREMQALASAQRRYPGARLEGDNIVISVEEFLEG